MPDLKKKVDNKARVEGSISEAYIIRKFLIFVHITSNLIFKPDALEFPRMMMGVLLMRKVVYLYSQDLVVHLEKVG